MYKNSIYNTLYFRATFVAQHMEVKRENESLRNRLAEATLMQKKLEQDIVGLEKVGAMCMVFSYKKSYCVSL